MSCIKTKTGENTITFDAFYQYIWARNYGDTDVYISNHNNIVAGDDDVALLPAGEAVRLTVNGKTLYVLGSTTLEVHAQNFSDSPFAWNEAGEGGGSEPVIESITITENGTYTAPSGVDGYSPVIVNEPYTVSAEYIDYISFAGRSKAATDKKFFVELPYTLNADHKITVVFNTSETYNNQAVIGNSAGANYIHLTQYNSKWYTSSGTSEINFSESTTGKHTFVVNDNGHLTFDGTNVASYTPTTNNNIGYWLPSRNDSRGYLPFTGYIYSYKIESISNGTVICELKPIKLTVKHNDDVLETLYGFIDIINDVFYRVEISQ